MTRPIDVPRPPAPTPAEPFPAPWPGGPCIDAWTVVGDCEGDGTDPCSCSECVTFAASVLAAPVVTIPAGDSHRYCQRCGRPAEIHDLDGSWCSPECRQRDRQSAMAAGVTRPRVPGGGAVMRLGSLCTGYGAYLREAAQLMRQRAQAATPGPWRRSSDGELVWPERMGDPVSGSADPADSDHIASWHPAVTALVGDLLEAVADGAQGRVVDLALAVARTYLGGAR